MRSAPRSASVIDSIGSCARFNIVFAVVSGSGMGILADLTLMQNAPLNLDRDASYTQALEVPEAVIPYVKPEETGGPSGPEPTRFGDWERKGRCIDF
jgi:hypothetical protein